ncbi:MAG: hypothetical protein AUH29_05570 [Candidatus Rokubacteria bacterium 13_1_40CM_69_27]|nr:MAG: hypothetical protein AUH29_05570 [Candidatus Rokubacteria bacterium 13_1_40CM_69_27]OLC32466.1 MAG: hypothetical protein AUH81_16110 [Candidatus Rokubacteria bacterium 13_1_40CM_4_69_5]OLE39155.1 MAG: hypothetical protein AUG00_03260 [Candidatus Rokubacteria bacterium 13_1_20CM_2_70_7]
MTKREFLRGLTVGAAALTARPAVALAERIRILPADSDVGPIPTGMVSPELQRLVTSVRVGEARAHGALLVFWLHAVTTAPPLAVATLEEARSRGDLVITEREQATVPSLVVENRGKIHALLLAGEILLGGKQNRVVTEDILLPPLSGPLTITVYCVEQGRWRGRAQHFESKGSFAAPGLRARVMERADQGRVWAEVSKYAARAAAPSETGSYQAIYDKPEVKEHQQEVERTLDHRAAPGARGAAVFVGQSLAGLDLFEDAGLFARQWPKLLRAHALEAYGRHSEADGWEGRLRQSVQSLLQNVAKTEGTLRRNAGAGRLFEFRVDGARGAALVAEAQVVHAACL